MLLQRMIGVLRLDRRVFEEIERDPEATNQAFMVVVLSGVAGGVGQIREDTAAVAAGVTANLGAWSLFALLAWQIGDRVFGTPETSADWHQLARTLGFAYTPMLLSAAGFIPVVGDVAFVVGLIWFVAATVVAMRQALDFTTARAIGTGLLSLVGYVVVLLAIFAVIGQLLAS
jgi:hypothetical protein